MRRRILTSTTPTPFAVELSAEEVLADLDPGWLDWDATVASEVATAA